MENKLAYKIFGTSENLTREEMTAALSDGDGISQVHAQRVMQSEFEADALEGFLQSKAELSDLSVLDQKMERYLSEHQKPGSNNTFIIGIWVISICATAATAFLLNTAAPIQENKVYVEPKSQQNIENPSVIQEPKGDALIALTDERFIVSDREPKKETAYNPKSEVNPSYREPVDVFNKMADINVMLLEDRNKHLQPRKPLAKEVMLAEFVFVDYRGIRVEKDFTESELGGLRANLNERVDANHADDQNTDKTKLSYHEFLAETASLMKDRNFAAAALQFKIILKQYPDDANALFYLAFIKYNKGAFNESLKYLEQSENAYYGNFDEETAWYILKNYLELNKRDLVLKQAQKIIDADGFYKKQAEEVLKNQ